MVVPGREIYWNVSGYNFQYLFLLVAAFVFGYGIRLRYRAWLEGGAENRRNDSFRRLATVLREILTHRRLLRYPYTGVFHYTVSIGFLILFFGTVAVFIEADLGIRILSGRFYLFFQSFMLDMAGVAALGGVVMAYFQRYILRPTRYASMSSGAFVLIGLFVLLASGFLLEGLRISATGDPWGKWSPVGYLIGLPLGGVDVQAQRTLHRFLWWFHMATAFLLLSYMPFTKLKHILFAPLNIYFRRLDVKGVTVDPIQFESAEKLGAESILDLSWKHLLDFDACTECGRCQDVCPVYLSEQPFSPRDVILHLRNDFYKMHSPNFPILDSIGEETIWFCRTCRACMEECPVYIEHVSKFIEARRFQVMEKADFPKTLHDPIESLESRGHAYRGTPVARTDWCKGLEVPTIDEGSEVELLYWVGCTTSLNEDNWGIARSLSALLKKENISFAILGDEEVCCGEPARRIGNEFLFDQIVRTNIETLKHYRFKAILTGCPHCMNMLRNEYRVLGADFEVHHHSEYLFKLLQKGWLNITKRIGGSFAYHDPCYLGRYNDIYEEPRRLIEKASAGGLIEMHRSRSRSFCCGGGGGGAWLGEEKYSVQNRLNVRRAQQFAETGASALATACPFCRMMLKDGIRTVSDADAFAIYDIAEIVDSAATGSREGGEKHEL